MSTSTLFRPVGPEELALIEASGWRRFPPRLSDQPIFYPVCDGGYAREAYRRRLAELSSMSRTGDCWDNAVSESFFGTPKAELVDRESYATHAAAHASIAEYIERFYNLQRRHSHNGYLSPIEFEVRSLAARSAG